MVFSSITFLLIFLPAVFILYFFGRKAFRNTTVLIVSLLFYFWGEQSRIALLLGSIVVNFGVALLLEKFKDEHDPQKAILHKKGLLSFAIVFNLGMLAYFKYCNFFIDNLNSFFLIPIEWSAVALPIGISFYTFQALSYIIDVYRGEVKATKNIITFGCYLTFFPQLIAGPIVRYIDIEKKLQERTESVDEVAYGIERFIIGLGKKVLIANTVGRAADIIFASSIDQINPLVAWVGALCYMLQIYFDFSGYSDMAIGLGRVFGFHFHENFNYPYIASSVQDFWRRWHISLSTWFRDYLYIPLGGNRVSTFRLYFNLVIVFVLCGFWHGADWTFILWGLYFGLLLLIERLFLGKYLKKIPKFLAHFYTLFAIIISWVLFRSENLPSFALYIKNMFGFGGHSNLPVKMFLDYDVFIAIGLGILFSVPIAKWTSKVFHLPEIVTIILKYLFLIGIFALSILSLSSNSFNPFLYFRF